MSGKDNIIWDTDNYEEARTMNRIIRFQMWLLDIGWNTDNRVLSYVARKLCDFISWLRGPVKETEQ